MIWLFLRDQVIQVSGGQRVQVQNGTVSVFDSDGRSVGEYDSKLVLSYTWDEQLATLLKQQATEPESRPQEERKP